MKFSGVIYKCWGFENNEAACQINREYNDNAIPKWTVNLYVETLGFYWYSGFGLSNPDLTIHQPINPYINPKPPIAPNLFANLGLTHFIALNAANGRTYKAPRVEPDTLCKYSTIKILLNFSKDIGVCWYSGNCL